MDSERCVAYAQQMWYVCYRNRPTRPTRNGLCVMQAHRNPIECPLPGDVWLVPAEGFRLLAVVVRVDACSLDIRTAGSVRTIPIQSYRGFLSGAEKIPDRQAA